MPGPSSRRTASHLTKADPRGGGRAPTGPKAEGKAKGNAKGKAKRTPGKAVTRGSAHRFLRALDFLVKQTLGQGLAVRGVRHAYQRGAEGASATVMDMAPLKAIIVLLQCEEAGQSRD